MGTGSTAREKSYGQPVEKQKGPTRLALIISGAFALFIIIASGLCSGLGLRLNHERIAVPPVETNTSGGTASSPTMPPWRRDMSEYDLDMDSWDIDAKPTTRNYNFVLSEVTAAPDGAYRIALVMC